jgi:hypothetical protein
MTFRIPFRALAFVLALLLAPTSRDVRAQATGNDPETVMVILHVRHGSEDQLAQVIANHWETARRLNLVLDTPRVTLKGMESGGDTYFVDIFTWRDASIPDSAPTAIQALWGEMNTLVESRNGKRGIEIAMVKHVK